MAKKPEPAVLGAIEFFGVSHERDLVNAIRDMTKPDRDLVADVFGFEGARLGTASEIVARYGFADAAAVGQRLGILKTRLARA